MVLYDNLFIIVFATTLVTLGVVLVKLFAGLEVTLAATLVNMMFNLGGSTVGVMLKRWRGV